MMRFRFRILLPSLSLLMPLMLACERQETERTDVAPDPGQTAPAPGAPAAGTAAQLPPELEGRANEYIDAWNGNDPASVANFFTEDATAMVGDSTYRGRAAIQERWLTSGVPVVTNLQVTSDRVEQRGDGTVVEGRYTYTARPPEGEVEQGSGQVSTTWVREADGSWSIRSTTVEGDE